MEENAPTSQKTIRRTLSRLSLTSCTPAEPVSVSPAKQNLHPKSDFLQ